MNRVKLAEDAQFLLKEDGLKRDSFESREVEGLTMSMLYLSYTKITIFLEIIRFKMMYLSGQGFGGFGGYGRFSR